MTDLFERWGKAWDRLWYTSPGRTRREVAAILAVLGGLPLEARILDVGCGTGRHALVLARLGYRVLGVDRAPAMVRAAREKAARRRLARRARFVLGDARALPVRSRSVHVALSLCEGGFGAAEARAGDRALLREVARALAPGGVLVLVALNKPWLDRSGDWRYDPVRDRHAGYERHTLSDGRSRRVEVSTRAYRAAEAARLLRRAGLEVVERCGAEPGGYAAIPLDEHAMQYMLVGKKPRGGG